MHPACDLNCRHLLGTTLGLHTAYSYDLNTQQSTSDHQRCAFFSFFSASLITPQPALWPSEQPL